MCGPRYLFLVTGKISGRWSANCLYSRKRCFEHSFLTPSKCRVWTFSISFNGSRSETIEQYIIRLRQKAEYCQFHNTDEMIRDQVIEKYSNRLRRKLLETTNVTLERLRQISQAFETSQRQVNGINGHGRRCCQQSWEGQKVFPFSRFGTLKFWNRAKQKRVTCYACGKEGHVKRDPNCPAKGKTCHKCTNVGHFAKCCWTGHSQNKYKDRPRYASTVKQIKRRDNSSEDDVGRNEYVVSVNSNTNSEGMVHLTVGGVDENVVIDSRAGVNLLDRNTWERMKRQTISCISQNGTSHRKLYPHGHH